MPGETEGQILGGLLNAGGNIAGAFLGQESNSDADRITPFSSTRNNLELAASNFDQLGQLGFADINRVPTPFAQLVDQIQALPITEKTKRRGLVALRQAMAGEEVTLPTYLKSILTRVGLSEADLPDLIQREEDFRQQRSELADISGINTDTVRSRAEAAKTAAQFINQAAQGFGGQPLNSLQNSFLDRINRSIDDSEERTLLQGRFGGFNPSAGLEGIADLRADAELRAIEQSLFAASGITNALKGSNASQAAQLSSNASLGALGIAANQASIANQLQQRTNQNNALAMANGISGAFGSLGDAAVQAGASFNQDFQDFTSSMSSFGGGGSGGGFF